MGTADFGSPVCGPWLQVALRVLFWLYMAVSFIAAIGLNMCHFHYRMGRQEPLVMLRVLPYFPTMLGGTVASVLAQYQLPGPAVDIIVAGLAMQGFGFLISLIIYAEYFYSLSRNGFPHPSGRPQMFIAVGPLSFTAIALIGDASVAQKLFPAHYVVAVQSVKTGDVAMILAVVSSIFMWLMAFFFFLLSVLSLLSTYKSLHFSLAWWSCIFPNTGFTLATIRIGVALESQPVLWVASAMTIVLVVSWLTMTCLTIWAVWTRRLLWPSSKEK